MKPEFTVMESQKFLRHGDVPIRRLETTSLKSIPKEARPDGKILMHGEATGHHHKVESGQVLLLEKPIQMEIAGEQIQVEKFLRVEHDTILEHQEHKTIPIPIGEYLILQERQYNPFDEEIRKVMD